MGAALLGYQALRAVLLHTSSSSSETFLVYETIRQLAWLHSYCNCVWQLNTRLCVSLRVLRTQRLGMRLLALPSSP